MRKLTKTANRAQLYGHFANELTNNCLRKLKPFQQFILVILLFIVSCSKSPEPHSEQLSGSEKFNAKTSVALPGGRANYVVTLIGETAGTNYKWCRLARYAFTTAGTVTEEFNYWDQNFTGNAFNNKVLTGFATTGCWQGNCVVKTPIGFQPGATPSSLSGTYRYDVNGLLVITWTGGSEERWSITNPTGKAYSKLSLVQSNYNAHKGNGFGSTASFTTGATVDQMKAAGSLTNYVYWQSPNVGAPIAAAGAPLYLGTFTKCNPAVLTGPELATTPVCSRYGSYIAAPSTSDKRKTYWNHQQGVVRCADGGGNCISPEAGHTVAMLQIIDDAGVFQGFVAAEASLHSMSTSCAGCAYIGSFYWVK